MIKGGILGEKKREKEKKECDFTKNQYHVFCRFFIVFGIDF